MTIAEGLHALGEVPLWHLVLFPVTMVLGRPVVVAFLWFIGWITGYVGGAAFRLGKGRSQEPRP